MKFPPNSISSPERAIRLLMSRSWALIAPSMSSRSRHSPEHYFADTSVFVAELKKAIKGPVRFPKRARGRA